MNLKITDVHFVKETDYGFEIIDDLMQGQPIILVTLEEPISESSVVYRRYVYYSELNTIYSVDVMAAQQNKVKYKSEVIYTKARMIQTHEPIFQIVERAMANMI